MKCSTVICKNDAKFIVYWPGKVPPPNYCEQCKDKACALGAAIGLAVDYRTLDTIAEARDE